jgi:hypothetical protein
MKIAEIDNYCGGLLSGAREMICDKWTPADAEMYLREIRSPEFANVDANRPDFKSRTQGHNAALRALRDCATEEDLTPAIDLISSRLWKLGAEKELDEFLVLVGFNEEDAA